MNDRLHDQAVAGTRLLVAYTGEAVLLVGGDGSTRLAAGRL